VSKTSKFNAQLPKSFQLLLDFVPRSLPRLRTRTSLEDIRSPNFLQWSPKSLDYTMIQFTAYAGCLNIVKIRKAGI